MKLDRTQQKEVLASAQELVRIPGTSGNEGQVVSLLNQKMMALGYYQVHVDSYGSVVGVVEGLSPGLTLSFDGHTAVVSIREPDLWSCDPYGGVATNGKLMGRGAADIKASLAAMMCAASYIDRATTAGTIIVSVNVAEELMPGRALEKILDEFPSDTIILYGSMSSPSDLCLVWLAVVKVYPGKRAPRRLHP